MTGYCNPRNKDLGPIRTIRPRSYLPSRTARRICISGRICTLNEGCRQAPGAPASCCTNRDPRMFGLASAGQGARAQDAGTVFTNPAGMMQLKDSQLLAGIVPNFDNFAFSPNATTSHTAIDGGNALVPLPGGSFFYVHSLSSNLKLSFGAYSYFGAPLEYNLNWVGRYRLQGATMLGMSFQPSFAFRAADWLSIGGGLDVKGSETADAPLGETSGASAVSQKAAD